MVDFSRNFNGDLALINKTVTENGTYNASSDNALGYKSVTVNVSGSNSGSGTTYNYPNLIGNYFVLEDETIEPMWFSTCDTGGKHYDDCCIFETPKGACMGYYNRNYSLYQCDPIVSTALSIINTSFWLPDGSDTLPVKHISLGFISNIPTGIVFSAEAFTPLADTLRSIKIRNNVLLSGAVFGNCSLLTEVNVSEIDDLAVGTFRGTTGTGGPFTRTGITTLSFNSLKSTSFGSATNQFNNMLRFLTGVTVHFPSNLQSVIGGWSSVTSGFGGTNTTVLFDLPATT